MFVGVLVACVWAFYRPESRQIAVVMVGISMLSFLALYALNGMPESLRLIAIVDLIGLPFLLIAGVQAFHA
jgi:hypothetical protein